MTIELRDTETPSPSPSKTLRAILGGFLFGVAIASFWFAVDGSLTWGAGLIAMIAPISAAIIWWRMKRSRTMLLFAFLMIALGFARYLLILPTLDSVLYAQNQEARVVGTIVNVKQRGSGQRLVLGDLLIDDEPRSDRLQVSVPMFPEWSYGERVQVHCDLELPEPFDGFRYDRYLASKDVYLLCRTFDVPLLVDSPAPSTLPHSWRRDLMRVRVSIIDHIDTTFGEPHGSLLAGLLLGEQRFTTAWQDRFVATGTTHIVAASGYNVAVSLMIAMWLLTALGLPRSRALAWLLASAFVYVLLAGAEAPVVRAGIMGVLVLFARHTGRHTTMTNVLLLTASLMLFVNPRLLRDDVGFQLSMISTIGLIYLAPHLDRRLKWIPKRMQIRESLTSTLAATLVTLPIIIFGFRRISLIGPIANLIVLPLVPLAMAFGMMATMISYAHHQIGAIASGPAWALLSLMLWIIEILATIPGGAIEL